MPNVIITAAPMRPHQLLSGIEAARKPLTPAFFGLGCDCFRLLNRNVYYETQNESTA